MLQYFATDYNNSGKAAKMFNTVLYGLDGTTLRSVDINSLGQLVTVNPADAYTLAYTGDDLTTVTRSSDSKVLTLTWVAGKLTAVSDWA